MTAQVTTAIVLAAGCGERLPQEIRHQPKGLTVVGGEPLVARSLRLLRAAGVRRLIVVVGFKREAYQHLRDGEPSLELVENADYQESGTLTSLGCALERVDTDALVLESDLLYEARALGEVLGDPRADVVLASGFTRAGDEVWVDAADGLLRGLSKVRAGLREVVGEFVGITKISAPLGAELARLARSPGAARHSYETDALVRLAVQRPIGVRLVPDLVWGELDDAAHLERLRTLVAPAIAEREGRA